MSPPNQDWALALYRRSVIKQEKVRRILAFLGTPKGKTCLDIGGDNGVVSLLLRQEGGAWCSADLEEKAVASIRQLVGSDAYRIGGETTPFPDSHFDVVVVVDFLEHIETDREFARDLHRISKPEGRVIVNVPHLRPGAWVNRLRNAIGLTDARHGHVRPGYDLSSLGRTLGDGFLLLRSQTYSRAFSEIVDALLNAAYRLRSRGSAGSETRKGVMIDGLDFEKRKKELRFLSFLYPILWICVRLDHLLFWQVGYRLIAEYEVRKT